MQIVIEITEGMYKAVKDGMWCGSESWYNALKNGTPLKTGQEPCDDCISRQAVDTLVDELARAISDERCCLSRGRSPETIMRDILDLPPVTPVQTRWIPVSERLPEKFEEVLSCTDEEEIFIAQYLGIIDGEPVFDDYEGYMWNGKVIAWFTLPEPYKAESEGN